MIQICIIAIYIISYIYVSIIYNLFYRTYISLLYCIRLTCLQHVESAQVSSELIAVSMSAGSCESEGRRLQSAWAASFEAGTKGL